MARSLIVSALAILGITSQAAPATAADSAVIVIYHRFGEDTFPSTNIRLEQFEAHIAELKSGPYTVLPVPEIVAAIREGRELPDRTVGITIDDGYASIYNEAFPRLRDAGFPFTVFVSTGSIDRRAAEMMTWDQLREMRSAGATIGGHTASHLHMPANSMERNRKDMVLANERMKAELGAVPDLFAYPYGEASKEISELVRELGHRAAFGQHSAPMQKASDPYYLPRFSMNEAFGGMDRFRLVANALPIPYADMTPSNPTLSENPPRFGFTRTGPTLRLNRVACYAADQGKVTVQELGPRVEVRMSGPFPAGRARINCTAPGPDNRWRWLGTLYYVPRS